MVQTSYQGFVNAHTHSNSIPYKGASASTPFELWLTNRLSTRIGAMTPEEQAACALVCGLENLEAGAVGVMDHIYCDLTEEHVHGVAEAYEALSMRAWVFPNIDDLPMLCYTKEAYPNYPNAIPLDELPEEIGAAMQPRPFEDRVEKSKELIKSWKGRRVQMGFALGNPVWCSDELLQSASEALRELDVPLEVHAEESPVQREVSLAQWGMSGVQRLDKYGLLSPRTIVAHCVQASDEDIAILGDRGCSVSHNPLSNLKLHNGIGPVGKLLKAGVNVCLGSDGPNACDEQSLFPVMRITASLARLNGIQDRTDYIESQVVHLASSHGHRLWFPGSISEDRVEYDQPVDPVRLVWTDMAASISEVYVEGQPILEQARAVVEESGARELVVQLAEPPDDTESSTISQQLQSLLKRYARSI